MMETTSTGSRSLPPICPTWADHEWGEPQFVRAGTHPVFGWYRIVRTVCRRCHRSHDETQWVTRATPV